MEYYHIFPCADILEHDTEHGDSDTPCFCNPEKQYDFDEDICYVIHDALDGRE